jgi:branched-subunit amino acid transport protein
MSYSTFEIWSLVALLALVTLSARAFFLVLPRRWQPRGRVEQALRYAPLAALLAITVPEIVLQVPAALQHVEPAWMLATDPRLVSALVLVAVIRLTRHTLWGLVAGSATYLVLLRLPG